MQCEDQTLRDALVESQASKSADLGHMALTPESQGVQISTATPPCGFTAFVARIGRPALLPLPLFLSVLQHLPVFPNGKRRQHGDGGGHHPERDHTRSPNCKKLEAPKG